ncbi:MAG: hypothetical protein A2293_04070 [Elusimicrobia bacterium RIFOXYB2_FULL_49_7]|nr:MAG: hypothetical protein A2293_04070 [Elusimicrobia bacterium RIFOXYB2_FULL_49_7]
MNNHRIAGLFLSALLLVALSGCGGSKENNESGAPAPKKKPGVKVMVLKTQPIAEKIRVTGTVGSRLRTWINAPAEGTVLSLDLREGDAVTPGMIIGYIMSSDQQNMLAIVQAEYNQARNVAGNDSNATVQSAKARLDAATSLYKSAPIVSPIKGVVITKSVEPGAMVSVRQPLAEVADIQKLIVKTALPERYVSAVKTGQKVRVTVSGADSSATGVVSLMYPSVDTRSRTLGVEITLGTRKTLRPGMSAVVDITVASRPSALVVPYDAVLFRPNGNKFVFTVTDSTAHARKVTTGIETNSMVEITEGLTAGDKIILMGQDNIKDGAVVKIMDNGPGAKGDMKK